MIEVLELFFGESLDKSNLYHTVYTLDENGEIPMGEIGTNLNFDEVMALLKDETKQGYSLRGGFVLGGDMYAHLDPAFGNIWFSKRSLGTASSKLAALVSHSQNAKLLLSKKGFR